VCKWPEEKQIMKGRDSIMTRGGNVGRLDSAMSKRKVKRPKENVRWPERDKLAGECVNDQRETRR
jgi:hypothetical protein